MQAQLDREGWKRANCFGTLLRAKTAAEGELKTMSAVERVKERRAARQHGLGRCEAGQLVACTAWREKVPSRDTAAPMSRERRGEEAHGRLLFMEADFIFSNYSQTVQHLILLLKVNLFTLMSSSTLL